MFTTTYKNMKKFVPEISKRTRSWKPDSEEASHIERCVNPTIQEKYNLTHKTSSVHYADILLPIRNICRVKNKRFPFSNWHSGRILRHYFQELYQMECVIRASNPSIQRRFITIWVFTYSVDSIHYHGYKWKSSHRKWTRYMPIISSTIYLGKMKTSVTINSRHSFLSKTIWSNLHLLKIKLEVKSSSYVDVIYIRTHLNAWCDLSHKWNYHVFQRSTCWQKMMMYKSKVSVLQRYYLCQKGYIYKIFMCNDPLPKINLSKRMLSLHAIVMAFSDDLEGRHHQCAMDNIYNSDAIFEASYIHEKNY